MTCQHIADCRHSRHMSPVHFLPVASEADARGRRHFGCDKEKAMTAALRWSWVGDPLAAVSGLSVSALRGTLTEISTRGNPGEKHMSATKFQWSALALAALLGLASAASAADVSRPGRPMDRSFDAQYPHLDALYKDIHAHPELGFQENAHRRQAGGGDAGAGLRGHRGRRRAPARRHLQERPGPHGDGPHRARCAADAGENRPALRQHGQQMWRDAETPVAHSCGHDIHMAAWVAAAKTLIDDEGPVAWHA